MKDTRTKKEIVHDFAEVINIDVDENYYGPGEPLDMYDRIADTLDDMYEEIKTRFGIK